MNRKIIALILPATLLLGACSQNNVTGSQTSSTASLKGVTAGMFDLPSSVANSNPSIQVASTTSLAKAAETTATDTNLDSQGLEAYKLVPVYIHIADAVKDSVRVLIEKFTAMNPPDSFSGVWNGYDVRLASRDTTVLGESLKFFWLTMKKDSVVVLHLQYARNGREQYRGSCYYHTETTDSTAFLLRFNNFNEGLLGARMVLWITKPKTQLNSTDDPNVIRVRAVRTPAGRILVSGVSLHPTFAGDGFWTTGPKVYGYQAVSNPIKDETVLRVAFANQADVGADFFTKYSLDKSVAARAAEILKDTMANNSALASLVFFSIDKNESLDTISGANALTAMTYTSPTHTVASFSAANLETYLTINTSNILAGNDVGMKHLLFLVKVKQPIFLSQNATIVGYAEKTPAGFSLDSSSITSEKVSAENAISLQDSTVTDALVNTDDSI